MNELLQQLLAAMAAQGIEIPEDKQGDLNALFQNQIGSFVKKENSGLEANRNKVLEDMKRLKSKFGDEDEFEKLKRLSALVDQDEELKLISEGRHEEVFAKRIAKQKEQWETAISTKDSEMAELQKTLESLKSDKAKMLLDIKVESFARSAKGFKADDEGAMEIFKMLVAKDWGLGEDGELAYKDADRISKGGKAFKFEDYIAEDIQPKFGGAFFTDVQDQGAGVKPNEGNPYYRGRTENLDQMGGNQRDNMSDEDWIAKRKEQMSKR